MLLSCAMFDSPSSQSAQLTRDLAWFFPQIGRRTAYEYFAGAFSISGVPCRLFIDICTGFSFEMKGRLQNPSRFWWAIFLLHRQASAAYRLSAYLAERSIQAVARVSFPFSSSSNALLRGFHPARLCTSTPCLVFFSPSSTWQAFSRFYIFYERVVTETATRRFMDRPRRPVQPTFAGVISSLRLTEWLGAILATAFLSASVYLNDPSSITPNAHTSEPSPDPPERGLTPPAGRNRRRPFPAPAGVGDLRVSLRTMSIFLGPEGLEPPTCRLEGGCSIQLSYDPTPLRNKRRLSGRADLNRRYPAPKAGALAARQRPAISAYCMLLAIPLSIWAVPTSPYHGFFP